MSPFSSANDSSGAGNATDGRIGDEHQGSFQYTQKRIAEEIKRLMQEQDSSSPPKPKKQQVRRHIDKGFIHLIYLCIWVIDI